MSPPTENHTSRPNRTARGASPTSIASRRYGFTAAMWVKSATAVALWPRSRPVKPLVGEEND